MLITVKYHGPTDFTGSRWSATMETPSAYSDQSIRCYEHFQYGEEDGSKSAAQKVINRWEDMVAIDRSGYEGSWSVEYLGQTHKYDHIFKAVWTYAKDCV